MRSRAGRPVGTTGVWLLYTGGLLGPLGGALVNAMLPELAADFDTSVDTVGTSVTAFLLPFAVVMLWSGGLADRWGLKRTLCLGYAVYTLASVACVLAPNVTVFLVARAGQGVANSLVTPVLIAVLARGAAPGRLGRTLGLFGSCQALGQATAPALGGLAAEVDWRLGFLGVAVTATLLGLAGTRAGGTRAGGGRGRAEPAAGSSAAGSTTVGSTAVGPKRADEGGEDGEPGGRPGALASAGRAGEATVDPGSGAGPRGRRSGLVLPASVALTSYATFIGLMLMATLIAADRFDASSSARGAIVATSGIAGLAAGFIVGHFLDRVGPVRCGAVAGVVLTGAALLTAGSGHVALLVGAMALLGLAGTTMRAATNVLAVRASGRGEIRAGATSVVLAFQFLGGALAPLLWLPLYGHGPVMAVAVCSSGGVVAVAILVASEVRSHRASHRTARPRDTAGVTSRSAGHGGEPAPRE